MFVYRDTTFICLAQQNDCYSYCLYIIIIIYLYVLFIYLFLYDCL